MPIQLFHIIHAEGIKQSLHLFNCLSISQVIYPSVHQSIHVSVNPSLHPFVWYMCYGITCFVLYIKISNLVCELEMCGDTAVHLMPKPHLSESVQKH